MSSRLFNAVIRSSRAVAASASSKAANLLPEARFVTAPAATSCRGRFSTLATLYSHGEHQNAYSKWISGVFMLPAAVYMLQDPSAKAAEIASKVDPSTSASSTEKPPERQIEPFKPPTPEEIRGQDIWNNCAVRSVFSGIAGGGLGIFMGLFLGALENPLAQEQMTAKQQFIYTAKQMGSRSWNSAKAFAVMGLIFSGVECVVEKARAKHDTTNTVVAGCVTGGALSAKGGPKAACFGCAGFATFSVLIEKFLDRDV